jgi:eukaryotic-like serine/threonine-protein kinase
VPPGDRREDEVAPTLAAADTPEPGAARDEAATPTLPASDPKAAISAADGRLAGQRLGRYEIEYLIGRGGMGEVYAAYDPNLDRPVAVKVLLAGVHGEAHTARLVREAQALARLQHPNVVAVYDAGEDGGHVFLAMQYVEGETLAVHLRGAERTWKQVLELFLAAGRGLAAAHVAGVVHRDFKPSNVMVDRAGLVAVTDFGLARHADDPIEPASDPTTTSGSGRRPQRMSDPVTPTSLAAVAAAPSASGRRGSRPSRDLTRVGEMIGTPAYMPSEQLAGAEISPATDQFAFCVSVWEALFDRHPYAGTDTDGTPVAFAAALARGVLHLPERHPVPKRVVAALTRGLANDPAKRWPSMTALLAELSRAVRPLHAGWIAAAAGVVVIGGAVGLVLALQDDPPPSCAAMAKARVETVWGPAQAGEVITRFTATDRAYAPVTATRVRDQLDAYARAWSTAAVDACTASRTGAAAARQRADSRVACLDRAHAALVGTVSVFTGELRGDVVDGAGAVLERLPVLDDCAAGDSAAAPPAAKVKRVSELESRLHAAEGRTQLGQPRAAADQLARLAPDIAAIDWPPLRARYEYLVALTDHELGAKTYAPMMSVAGRARELGLHRLELDAACYAMVDARDQSELDGAVTVAQAAAQSVGGPQAALRAVICNGVGLNRQRKFREASSLCRDARKAAIESQWTALEDQAIACLIECLVPLDGYTELEPILTAALDNAAMKRGPGHPLVGSYLLAQSMILVNQGKLAEAEAVQERALAIRRRAYGDNDLRVAAVMRELGETATAVEDFKKAKQMLTDAMAIVMAQTPPSQLEIWKLERDLGLLAVEESDMDAAREHMRLAVEAATRQHGGDSIEVAFLLVMAGQYQTAVDLDGGLATLNRAVAIFDAHGDPRAATVRGVLGRTLMYFDRHEEAIVLLEGAIHNANLRDVPPVLQGQMSQHLAEGLLELGERQHARQHAEDALVYYARGNELSRREYVRDWIRDNKLGAYQSDKQIEESGKPPPNHRIPR